MITFHSQRIARAAFQRVENRVERGAGDKYLSFARAFPTLIHTSGLAQASAFALAKGAEKRDVLNDLAEVINAADPDWPFDSGSTLHEIAVHQATGVRDYIRLTRHALEAATWIKRYAEALIAKADATDSNATAHASVDASSRSEDT